MPMIAMTTSSSMSVKPAPLHAGPRFLAGRLTLAEFMAESVAV